MFLSLSNLSRLMVQRSWFCALILMLSMSIGAEVLARGGGGRSNGGSRNGGASSGSVSRGSVSRGGGASPSMSRPTASSSRSSTSANRAQMPQGGTRPSASGSRPIGSGTSRPNVGSGNVGSDVRPSQNQLQKFLDLPSGGGGAFRPASGSRTARGNRTIDGVGQMPSSNAASDFLQNRGPQTGQLPGLADRANLPGTRELRAGAGDRVNAAERQDRVNDRGKRSEGREDRMGTRQDRRTTGNGNRVGRVEDMSQRTQDRYDRRDEVREQMHDHYPRYDFYKDHPDYARYRWNHPYHWATWAAVSNWFPWGWANARQYNYGGNVYYDNSTVYYEGQPIATADEYAQQAMTIAESAPEPEADSDWMSLGVFALTQDGEASGPAPTQFLQLAISKNGAVAGTFNNSTTDKSQELEGAVDQQSQRVAWVATGKQWPVMETGISGLTDDQTPVLIHFENGETQQWLMVRLEEPETTAGNTN